MIVSVIFCIVACCFISIYLYKAFFAILKTSSTENEGESKEKRKKVIIWFGLFIVVAILGAIGEYSEKKRVLSPEEIKERELKKLVWEEEAKQKEEKRLAEQKKKQGEKEKSYTVVNGKVVQSFPACLSVQDAKDMDLFLAQKDQEGIKNLLANTRCVFLKTGLRVTLGDSGLFDFYVPIRVYIDNHIQSLYINTLNWKEKWTTK